MLWLVVLILLILALAGGFALTHWLFVILVIVLIVAIMAALAGRGGTPL